jgi:hypothetical protein
MELCCCGKLHHKIWITPTTCRCSSMGKNCRKNFSHSNKFQFLLIRLCEAQFPYNTIARHAIHDMLNAEGSKVLSVIPQLIIPIKNSLNTKNRGIVSSTLRIIQHLCMCGEY